MSGCSSTSGAATSCLWIIGVVVLVSVVYVFCTNRASTPAPSSGSACRSKSGRAARRQFTEPHQNHGETNSILTRMHNGSFPKDQEAGGDEWMQTENLRKDQNFPKKALSVAGNLKGANEKAHNAGTQNGRGGSVKAAVIGINTNAWLQTIPRSINAVCVSFNDSGFRQDQLLSMSNCAEKANCPDGTPHHISVTKDSHSAGEPQTGGPSTGGSSIKRFNGFTSHVNPDYHM